MTARLDTETVLREWRYGQVQAERLVAQLLHLESYSAIDPQHPLGGPDGIKDVLFRRSSEMWLAAAFFPTTPATFRKVENKFKADQKGVTANTCVGIAFFTNQHLTIAQRAKLIKHAAPSNADIYDNERIARILDSPRGCGVRLQYLRIAMTDEEQWSFWQVANTDLAQQMTETRLRLERIEQKLNAVFVRTNNVLFDATSNASSLYQPMPSIVFATAAIDVGLLCWIHRIATEDSAIPDAARGRIRSVDVWLSKIGSPNASADWHPPAPVAIESDLDKLFTWWKGLYPSLVSASKKEVIEALARLHHELLLLHPFLDGNGRVARLVIDQAANELLGETVSKEMTADRQLYYGALQEADSGNLRPLEILIEAALR